MRTDQVHLYAAVAVVFQYHPITNRWSSVLDRWSSVLDRWSSVLDSGQSGVAAN